MQDTTTRSKLNLFPWEAVVWFLGLMALWISDPAISHFSLCPVAMAGFDWCPGCGLGRSISFLFRGEFKTSFVTHPFGFFAVIVLISRIVKLTKKYVDDYGKNY
jgi:hypothetical protein